MFASQLHMFDRSKADKVSPAKSAGGHIYSDHIYSDHIYSDHIYSGRPELAFHTGLGILHFVSFRHCSACKIFTV